LIKSKKYIYNNKKEKNMKERKCRNFHLQIRGKDVIVKFVYYIKKVPDELKLNLIDLNCTKCFLYVNELKFIGKAVCDPRDIYNKDEGEKMSMARAIVKLNNYYNNIEWKICIDIETLCEEIDIHTYFRLIKYQK
jgi:hypothetical protein